MSVIDDKKLMVRAAQLYYYHENNQKQISEKLGISRAQVSRLLTAAREEGIVEIKINNPFLDETELEQEIKTLFNLKDVLIYDLDNLEGEDAYERLGELAATNFNLFIPDNEIIGVMSGKTISKLVKNLKPQNKNALFVPLIGGLGVHGYDWYANIICQRFAEKFNSEYLILNAPILVSDMDMHRQFLLENGIKNVIQTGKKCKFSILGVGTIDKDATTTQAEELTKKELDYLISEGAVASIATSYLDIDGNIVGRDIIQRSIGVSIVDLRTSYRMALACGTKKAKAILATLKGGHIDGLITSVDTAKKILEIYKNKECV